MHRERAEQQTRVANATRLAAQSRTVLGEYPQRSLLLAVEAVEITRRHGGPRVLAAEQALRDSIEAMRELHFAADQGMGEREPFLMLGGKAPDSGDRRVCGGVIFGRFVGGEGRTPRRVKPEAQ